MSDNLSRFFGLMNIQFWRRGNLRIFYIFIFLVLVNLPRLACAGQAMTLEQCLQTGLENNPLLKASKFKVDAAGQDIKAARADFLPALSSSYSLSHISSLSSEGPVQTDYVDQDIHAFNGKLTQILYAGSRIVNTYGKAKFLEQASQADMNLAKLELAYHIEATFYTLMKAKQDVIATKESVNRLSKSVKSAEAFFQKELVPYVDVLKARVDLADAENQLSIAKNNENRQIVALFAFMDLPMDSSMEFIDEEHKTILEKPTFESSMQYAMENRPDIKSLEYQFKAANKQSDIALGKYLPVVKLEGGYYDQKNAYATQDAAVFGTYNRDQENKYFLAGITVSWDLFDGGRAYYERESSDLNARKIIALIKDAQNTIATGIRKALYSLSEAEQRLTSSTDAVGAAKENYTAEENRLKAGISTITQLLDAQSRLIRAQINKSNATLDYQLAKSELKLMSGGQKK